MMKRSRMVAASVLGALAVAALWAGCEGTNPAVTDGTSGASPDGSKDAQKDNGAAGADVGSDKSEDVRADADRSCNWTGWSVMPRMPPGYLAPCVPDDPSVRLPHLTWTPNDAWCNSCRLLDTPWVGPNGDPDRAVGNQVHGSDGAPSLVTFSLLWEDKSEASVVFDSAGTPVAAQRLDPQVPLQVNGAAYFGGFSPDGLALGYYIDRGVYDDHHSLIVPNNQIRELYVSTETAIAWPKDVLLHRVPNKLSFSSATIASDLMGDVAVGRLQTGKVVLMSKQLGAPSIGELSDSQVVGNTVFFGRYDYVRNDRWVYDNDEIISLMSDPDRDFRQLATDGTVMVWTEGSQPYLDPDNQKLFGVYDLYLSPYATTPGKLQRRKLLNSTPPTFGNLILRNGFVIGNYSLNAERTKTGVLAVRLSDGFAWKALLAPERSWTTITPFPAADEIWGTACTKFTNCPGATVVRFPYSTMEVLQTGFPDGGS